MERSRIGRRAFMVGSVAIAGGIAIGLYRINRPTPNPLLAGLAEGVAAITPFVRITREGITLIVPRADLGQGIASIQAYLIAEELDIDPRTVTLDPGQPHEAYANATAAADGLPFPLYDDSRLAETVRTLVRTAARLTGAQFTGGSSSVADLHEPLRRAGAVARETLKAAAALRAGLSRADLHTRVGVVVLPDGRHIAYTDLAVEAGRIEPVTDVSLREPASWRWLGKPMQRTDIVAKSTGQQTYGIDVSLPGMVHATVRINPGRGAGMRSFDAAAAQGLRGVVRIVPITDGVGVLADNTWRAFRAAQALRIDWEAPAYPPDSAQMWQALERTHAQHEPDSRLRDDGDVTAALARGPMIQAEYRTPYLAHAALEPLCATVLVTPSSVDIWTATQIPHVVRDSAASITGIPTDRVAVHVLAAGGSFGRRLDHDYLRPAIELAMAMRGTPVKTTWTREEDMSHDFPRPMQLARARGTVSEGRVTCLDLDTVGASLAASWLGRVYLAPPGPDVLLVLGAYDQPYAIPHYRVSGFAAPQAVPIGSWRAPGACSNAFFHECFLDELMHAVGADPLQERLRLINHEDSRRVLEAVGQMCAWAGGQVGEGRGRGLAFCYSHGVPVAEVVEVSVTEAGIRIEEVWIAADCGTVFDPVNAQAQLTGAAVFGLGHAINGELTYRDHAPTQTNFHQHAGLRLYQTPRFHTRLLGRAARVRGLGEPALPPAAPALANAIFAATGKRLREMPLERWVGFV